ncbi:matrixin family metalloprotease [Lentilactobacillus sp. IMAU92037]|nr:matrixin family metalloprotease [Lentilactobacillus dabitei]
MVMMQAFLLMMVGYFCLSVSAAAPITPHGTARFPTATATINISHNSTQYKHIWERAVQAWNRTGAFTFVLTKSKAMVTSTTDTKLSADYAGMAYIVVNKQGYLSYVDTEINPVTFKVFKYSTSEMVNVAEHELGHAIGLNHNSNRASVMYPTNRYYSIQRVDIEGVNRFYGAQSKMVKLPSRSGTFLDPAIDIQSKTVFDHFDSLSFSTFEYTPLESEAELSLVECLQGEQALLEKLASINSV